METNFSAENSLRLITETIERSRRTIAKNAGKPLILWGSLVALTAIVIWILWKETGSPVWNLLWFAMTAIGSVCQYYMNRNREKAPATEISRMLGKIWMWFGILATGFYILVWVAWGIRCAAGITDPLKVDLSMIIVMMMGLCGTISGSVLKLRSVTVPVVVATALSALFLMVTPDHSAMRILTFVILGVFALIVPGIILQKHGRN